VIYLFGIPQRHNFKYLEIIASRLLQNFPSSRVLNFFSMDELFWFLLVYIFIKLFLPTLLGSKSIYVDYKNKTVVWIFGGMILKKNRKIGRNFCPSATSFTTNPTQNSSRLNVALTYKEPISPKKIGMSYFTFAVYFRWLEKYLNNLE